MEKGDERIANLKELNTMDKMEKKMKMKTVDFTDSNIAKLAELFPNCVTESEDAHGNLKKSIDFDLLRQELSDTIVEGPQERFRLDWPGKKQALLTANLPIEKNPAALQRRERGF